MESNAVKAFRPMKWLGEWKYWKFIFRTIMHSTQMDVYANIHFCLDTDIFTTAFAGSPIHFVRKMNESSNLHFMRLCHLFILNLTKEVKMGELW